MATDCAVRGSAEDLRTAVFNVLDNAVKYSGDKVDVRVRLETPDEKRIVLRVQDQGVGIAPDDMKRIFKRFYRVTHRSLAHVKGTGLGLFIVKAIAKKHGGKVFAESEGEGQGTTIVLRIAEVGSMSRVLVVEDEAHLAQGLRFNLEAEGYAAEVVGDGEAATERLLDKKEEFRRGRARHHAAGKRRLQRSVGAAGGAELCARADADGARTSRRCAEGLRLRRGRLSGEAV